MDPDSGSSSRLARTLCPLAYLFFVALFFVTPHASATVTINVISPQAGMSAGSPVFYEAEAQTDCKSGISALRIYTAPGVVAYTTQSPHLETFISLSAGAYSTVVQAWDNCGAVAKVPVALTVTTQSTVTVFLPSASANNGPTHFAASAQSPGCSQGIASMRLYTSWGFAPYTVLHGQLDAYVQLSPGVVYSATMQAWDNCGNVLKTNFQVTGSTDADSHVYVGDDLGIEKFNVLSNGQLSIDSPAYVYPISTPIGALARHPGGLFLYASSGSAIYGFAINPQNGFLTPIAGSPWNFTSPIASLAIDPAGNFLYATLPQPIVGNSPPTTVLQSFTINRSSGSITAASSVTVPELVLSIATDPYGQFIYAGGSMDNNQLALIYAYIVQSYSGTFTATYGSPYNYSQGTYFYALATAYQYLFVFDLESTGDGNIDSYQINDNSGSLYPPLGPYQASQVSPLEHSVLADWLTRYVWVANNTNAGNSYLLYDVDGYRGTLGASTQHGTGSIPLSTFAEGTAATAVYTTGGSCGPVTCVPGAVGAWTIDVASGGLLNLLNSLPTQGNNPTTVVAVRAHPE